MSTSTSSPQKRRRSPGPSPSSSNGNNNNYITNEPTNGFITSISPSNGNGVGYTKTTLKRSGSTSSSVNGGSGGGGFMLTKYFLVILFVFGVLTLAVNTRVASVILADVSTLEAYLGDSIKSFSDQIKEDGIPSEDDDAGGGGGGGGENRNGKQQQQQQKADSATNDFSNKFITHINPPQVVQQQQKQQRHHEKRDEKDYNPFKVEKVDHLLAGLNCEKYGGPSNELAEEMVYWEDIPQDSKHISPFKSTKTTRYLTFEPDLGGWNNIRMGMETIMVREKWNESVWWIWYRKRTLVTWFWSC